MSVVKFEHDEVPKGTPGYGASMYVDMGGVGTPGTILGAIVDNETKEVTHILCGLKRVDYKKDSQAALKESQEFDADKTRYFCTFRDTSCNSYVGIEKLDKPLPLREFLESGMLVENSSLKKCLGLLAMNRKSGALSPLQYYDSPGN